MTLARAGHYLKEEKMEEVFVGSRELQVKDEINNLTFQVLVHYPTNEPSAPVSFGPLVLDVTPNGKLMSGKYPLVLISHGNGGTHILYRTISTYLAKNGYVVAMLEHYGNNRNNNTLGFTEKNLQYRPRHIKLTINELIADEFFGGSIIQDQISMIGHSFGGYTALAIAGGIPWSQDGHTIEVERDGRIKALVLMAPAAMFFMPQNSLRNVKVPILLVVGEKDHITPKQWTEDVILNGVPDKSKVQVKRIENAGHYSFLSPFPPELSNPGFPPSTDPAGFNREEFHRKLPKLIHDFLQK